MNAFNRDVALATWREFMRRSPALTEDRLEELEVHLLDHMDQLQAEGCGPDEAFRLASRRLGGYDEIEREYGKTKWGRTSRRDMLRRKLVTLRDMLATFYRSAVGSMRRHPGFTAINIVGFAVSLAAVLLISLYVHDERQFDAQHADGERIFRMGGTTTGWPYGRLVKDSHPEVEAVTYLRTYPELSIRHEGVYTFPEQLYADAEFLRMFDFPLVEGDRETALRAPGSVVVTQELATKLFGTTNVLGRRLVMNDSLDMAITGIMPRPSRSHISFDMLISFETLRAQNPEWFDGQMTSGWLNLNVTTYVKLAEHASAALLEERIAGLPMEHAGDFLRSWGAEYALTLTPMTDIYLDATGNMLGPSGSRALVRMLALVAAFLLLLALVNFVNLATARSTERAREVGIRKVAGSSRGLLVAQFVFEAVLMTLLATVLALVVAAVALPLLNALSGKTLPWTDLLAPGWLAALAVGAVVAGLMSGLYPSVVLSGFAPVHVLKGRRGLPRAGGAVRRGLVVLQFTISSVMVLGTLLVHSQINFMLSASPGFDAEEVMVVDTRQVPAVERGQSVETLRERLLAHPAVESVSAAVAVPGMNGWRGQLSFPEGWGEDESVSLEYIGVDAFYLRTMGLELVAGRDFDPARAADAARAVIINEAAVREVGWASAADAIGKQFTSPGSGKPDGVVIGVVRDYNHHGLQEEIGSIMYGLTPVGGLVSVRFTRGQSASVQEHVHSVVEAFHPTYTTRSWMLREGFARQYEQEVRLGQVTGVFSILAVVIALLGLFGLAAYEAVQRTREIGIRKVLGATSSRIMLLLVARTMALVLVGYAIAVPVVLVAIGRWQASFAYTAPVSVPYVLGGGLGLGVLCLVAVGYQAFRAGRRRPVHALRLE